MQPDSDFWLSLARWINISVGFGLSVLLAVAGWRLKELGYKTRGRYMLFVGTCVALFSVRLIGVETRSFFWSPEVGHELLLVFFLYMGWNAQHAVKGVQAMQQLLHRREPNA